MRIPDNVPEPQQLSINILMDRGFVFCNWIKASNPIEAEEGMCTAVMQKSKKFAHTYIEVDPNGACNGEPLTLLIS